MITELPIVLVCAFFGRTEAKSGEASVEKGDSGAGGPGVAEEMVMRLRWRMRREVCCDECNDGQGFLYGVQRRLLPL